MTPARTLGQLPDEAATRRGGREALAFEDRRLSFHQRAAEVDRVARDPKRLVITSERRPPGITAWAELSAGARHVDEAAALRERALRLLP